MSCKKVIPIITVTTGYEFAIGITVPILPIDSALKNAMNAVIFAIAARTISSVVVISAGCISLIKKCNRKIYKNVENSVVKNSMRSGSRFLDGIAIALSATPKQNITINPVIIAISIIILSF